MRTPSQRRAVPRLGSHRLIRVSPPWSHLRLDPPASWCRRVRPGPWTSPLPLGPQEFLPSTPPHPPCLRYPTPETRTPHTHARISMCWGFTAVAQISGLVPSASYGCSEVMMALHNASCKSVYPGSDSSSQLFRLAAGCLLYTSPSPR